MHYVCHSALSASPKTHKTQPAVPESGQLVAAPRDNDALPSNMAATIVSRFISVSKKLMKSGVVVAQAATFSLNMDSDRPTKVWQFLHEVLM